MAATQSIMKRLGSTAGAFILPDARQDNELVDLKNFVSKPLLLMFICNHCPFVLHIAESMVTLANRYQGLGYGVFAISSNDVDNYPQDGPRQMQAFAQQYGFEFPYCYDETQEVALAYGAVCTPDFFVYDENHKLVYRGQMDSARPGNQDKANSNDLAIALQAVLDGHPVSAEQFPSIGCSIKWKEGVGG